MNQHCTICGTTTYWALKPSPQHERAGWQIYECTKCCRMRTAHPMLATYERQASEEDVANSLDITDPDLGYVFDIGLS